MGMFDFFMDAGNYEDRKVANFVDDDFTIDTCSVSDGRKNYETAVMHILYNDNKWIIVEAYDTKEEAQKGHDKWVKIMSSKELPKSLKDCQNAEISEFLDEDDLIFEKQVI
jgi:hypothetical protein